MPAEVETLEGKSLSRVEIENVDEKKQETVGSAVNENVANGISHGGNDNGNCNGDDKEEHDGSYVFVTENDTVGDDPVASDTFHDRICDFVRPSDANVEKDGHGFVEGENGNPGEQKMEISQESQTMAESEADRADVGLIEAVVEITKSEMEGPRDGDLGNGKGEKLESTMEVEPIQESEVEPRGFQEKSEGQINTGRKIDVEGDQGNSIEGQDKSDMDVDFSKDLQHSEDAERPIESNVGTKSELISEETSLDDPKDGSLILEQSVYDPKDDGLILGQSVQADSGCTINVSESVKAPDSEDDDIRSESTAVAEPVSVERENSEGDALMVSEAEKAQPSHDAADDTTELGVPNVNGDAKAETHNLTVPSLDEDASKQSESRIAEVHNSVSDEGAQLEPEAADISASDERSDVIGLAKENVSGTAIADVLSCATQQEPEHTEPSELVETPSSPASLEAPATENETNGRGSSEDGELDIKQETKDESVLLGQEVTDVNEKFSLTGQNQENGMEVNFGTDADGCTTSAEEAESSQTGGLPRNVSDEGTKSISTSLSEPLIGLDSETIVPKLAEKSVNGAADEMNATAFEPEGVQSGRTCSELNDDLPTPEHSKIDIEVENNSKVNGTEDIPKDVCEDTSEDVCEAEVSNIKKGSVMNAAEEVESGTKSFYNTEFPLLSNGKVEAEVVGEPQEKDNESRWPTVCSASKTKTSIPNLEPEVTVSTDTTGTGDMNSEAVAESTDSKLAEHKGGIDVIENGNRTSTSADETDAKVASACEGSDGQSVNLQVDGETQKDQVSTCEASGGQSVNLHVDGETRKDRALASSGEVYTLDASEGQAIAAEIERKPFYFLPRVPRYDGENLAEQLKHAETQVDEKTQIRDAIGPEIQKIRVSCKELDANLKAAIAEERSARKALQSKRQEIESLQSVINRVKSAVSVDDIGSKVHSMEHMIQHETLTLNEEKQLIREIKQLKQLREQISSNMGTQDEVQQALDNQEKTEERLKAIRKELDVLRNDLSKAEAVTKAAREGHGEEWEKQSKLQKQFRDADAVRQEAYVLLQSLRKQLREKNKYFFKYRDDLKAAIEMALKKDREALQSFCLDQVETFMDLWNNDDEFRKNYIRCNARSTLRRLGTLDGRALGPDEEPPQIPHAKTDRADKLRSSNVRPETHEMVPPSSAHQEKVTRFEDSKPENTKAVAKPTEQKDQTTKSKKPAKSTPPPIGIASISGGEEMEESRTEEEEEEEEKPKLTKEEEEKLRKAEEKRKMEEAMKLKEQSRLEEIAKAKEAMERKKKREEKAKARFALRTQKEAEEKEKDREKKLRKKERKGIAESREIPLPSSDAQSETPKENESPEEKITTTIQPKKSQKTSQFLKQTKSKSIPPPLRNRSSKRRLKQYMWVAFVAVVALVVFLLGNANLSFSPSNLWFLI
ncbi:PREDICTED: titin homolog [Tarenaya hassleriana]|uniref:titin homolog n=1 Tax=Tarenaya hassleriana TaxID=28532 RepID=UPI00053C2232|nr:PREDICTED: titin homolog [Tarenaya hassleriana]